MKGSPAWCDSTRGHSTDTMSLFPSGRGRAERCQGRGLRPQRSQQRPGFLGGDPAEGCDQQRAKLPHAALLHSALGCASRPSPSHGGSYAGGKKPPGASPVRLGSPQAMGVQPFLSILPTGPL